MYKKAAWKNGKRSVKGRWDYFDDSDEFIIILDTVDSITGRNKTLTVSGDTPEWGNWKLVRDKEKTKGKCNNSGYMYNKRSGKSEAFALEQDSDCYDECEGYCYDMGDR